MSTKQDRYVCTRSSASFFCCFSLCYSPRAIAGIDVNLSLLLLILSVSCFFSLSLGLLNIRAVPHIPLFVFLCFFAVSDSTLVYSLSFCLHGMATHLSTRSLLPFSAFFSLSQLADIF